MLGDIQKQQSEQEVDDWVSSVIFVAHKNLMSSFYSFASAGISKTTAEGRIEES